MKKSYSDELAFKECSAEHSTIPVVACVFKTCFYQDAVMLFSDLYHVGMLMMRNVFFSPTHILIQWESQQRNWRWEPPLFKWWSVAHEDIQVRSGRSIVMYCPCQLELQEECVQITCFVRQWTCCEYITIHNENPDSWQNKIQIN